MTRLHLAASTRALVAGAVCLAIIGGMIVGHAWPLWTGHDVLLGATVDVTGRRAPGEYVQLSTAADVLRLDTAAANPKVPATQVRTIDPWVAGPTGRRPDLDFRLRGKTVYVQLEPGPGGQVAPVSVSVKPVAGAINLRGIVTWPSGASAVRVQYGLDAFYMQEGRARQIENAFKAGRRVQMQVAIAASGRARIRNLLIDGTPVK